MWDIVALAALTAMEKARVGLRAASNHAMGGGAEATDGLVQATGSTQATPPAIEVAKAREVLEFWQRIRGFAELGMPNQGWDEVGPNHPILSVAEGRLGAALPAEIEGEIEGG